MAVKNRYILTHPNDWTIMDTVDNHKIYATKNKIIAEVICNDLNNGTLTPAKLYQNAIFPCEQEV